MKKIFLVVVLFSSTHLLAQSSFGVTGGLNYADNGKIEYSDFTGTYEDITESEAERKSGYHFGVYYKAELGWFFLKPELLYTQSNSTYRYKDGETDYEVSSLDLPVLVGMDFLGPLEIFAGPSFRYVLENDFAGVTVEDLQNEFTVGGTIGIGAQIWGLGIDVRYEQALTEKQAEIFEENVGSVQFDSRPNMFIVSLSLNL